MDTLKLNSKQIQVTIDQFTAQPEGVNKLMEMALNSLMKAERADLSRGRSIWKQG